MILGDLGDSGIELSAPEQRAAQVMVRFALEAGYRGLRWRIPNDATWSYPHLAMVPVRYDGWPDHYELLGHRRLGSTVMVCSLIRRSDSYEVLGVPGEEWLRPLREVAPGAAAAMASPEPPVALRRERPPRTRPTGTVRLRRRTAAAALGLIIPAATLGGVIVIDSTGGPQQSSTATPTTPQHRPAAVPVLPAGGVQWATQARVTLASVRHQLAVVSQAEQAWGALSAERRAGEAPEPVRELEGSKVLLEQQRATLEANLAAWEALQQTTASLQKIEAQLADVERALQAAPGGAAPSGQQAARLAEQQRLLARQRDAQREQLHGWYEGVNAAVVTPLPEPPDAAPIAQSVIAITQQPESDEERDGDGGAPVVVAREPETDEVEQNAEPPEPDDPEDADTETADEPAEPEPVEDEASVPPTVEQTAPDVPDVAVTGSVDIDITGSIDVSVDGNGEHVSVDGNGEPDAVSDTTDDAAANAIDDAESDAIDDAASEPDSAAEPDGAGGDTADAVEDIDTALDSIEVDITIEDIPVELDGQDVLMDVMIDETGITVEFDEPTGDSAADPGSDPEGIAPDGALEDASINFADAEWRADRATLWDGFEGGPVVR